MVASPASVLATAFTYGNHLHGDGYVDFALCSISTNDTSYQRLRNFSLSPVIKPTRVSICAPTGSSASNSSKVSVSRPIRKFGSPEPNAAETVPTDTHHCGHRPRYAATAQISPDSERPSTSRATVLDWRGRAISRLNTKAVVPTTSPLCCQMLASRGAPWSTAVRPEVVRPEGLRNTGGTSSSALSPSLLDRWEQREPNARSMNIEYRSVFEFGYWCLAHVAK